MRILICLFPIMLGSFCLLGQYELPINVIVEEDQESAKDNPKYRVIRAEIIRQLSEASQLYNLVDRDIYENLIKERSKAQEIGENPYASSILNGAAQLIKVSIMHCSEQLDSTKLAPPKEGLSSQRRVRTSIVRQNAKAKVSYEFNLKLAVKYRLEVIDLRTTQVKGTRVLTAKGSSYSKISEQFELNKYKLNRTAWYFLKKSLFILNRVHVLDLSNLKIPILAVTKENKGAAEELLILGGTKASYRGGLLFKVVQETKVEIRGKEQTRVKTIGEFRLNSLGSEITYCKVTEGGSEILIALSQQENIYAVFSDKNKLALEWNSKPDKR